MTALATEEARAMSGRPAWRVAAACIKGVACPRCGVAAGVRCNGKTTCRERVWRRKAWERAGMEQSIVGAESFLSMASDLPLPAGAWICWGQGWRLPASYGGHEVDASGLARAIACGMVRLVSDGGVPAWVITEYGAARAEEWARIREEAKPSADPFKAYRDAVPRDQDCARAREHWGIPLDAAVWPVDAAAATKAFLERGKR